MTDFTLADLESIIARRASAMPEDSWTAQLLSQGASRVAKKFGEEAVELVIATVENDRPAIAAEAADVLYHLLVMLRARDVPVAEVMAELERRTTKSGVQEKAERPLGR
jgi:phosphoribosyl-ATP pyrophosphohydrolase